MKTRRTLLIIELWAAAVMILAFAPGVGMAGAEPTLEEQLLEAAKRGDIEAIKRQVDKGADISARWGIESVPAMPYGWTPLIWAAYRGTCADVVKVLLDRGVDVNEKAMDKWTTAVMAAAWKGNTTVVKILLDKGADPNDGLKHGRPFNVMWTCGERCAETVRLLLDSGADANTRLWDGRPVLVWAVEVGNVGIVKALLAKGADVNAKGRGWTALELARKERRQEIVDILRAHGAVE